MNRPQSRLSSRLLLLIEHARGASCLLGLQHWLEFHAQWCHIRSHTEEHDGFCIAQFLMWEVDWELACSWGVCGWRDSHVNVVSLVVKCGCETEYICMLGCLKLLKQGRFRCSCRYRNWLRSGSFVVALKTTVNVDLMRLAAAGRMWNTDKCFCII